jgi:hypothetical protein
MTYHGLHACLYVYAAYMSRARYDQAALGPSGCGSLVSRDPVTQRLDESHLFLTRHGVRLYPIVTRCAWPSELDCMVRLAGLHLKDRWAGWNREPFNAISSMHASVCGR